MAINAFGLTRGTEQYGNCTVIKNKLNLVASVFKQ